jgi:hypothetical protein
MNIHAEHRHAAQQTGPFGRLAARISAIWQARRARRMEEETVVCLSTIQPRLLNDIGIETGTLYEHNPNLGVVKTDAGSEGTGRLRQW